MNERIRELAVQARQYAWVNETHWSAGPERERLFEQKFAELIVKECMTIAQEYDGAKLGGPGMIIAMRIEQHFGVEE